jgi:hypothetical protein
MSRRFQAGNGDGSARRTSTPSQLPSPSKVEPITLGRARDIAEAWMQRYPPRMTPQERKLARMLHAKSAQPQAHYTSRTVLLPRPDACAADGPSDPVVVAVKQALAENKPIHKRPSVSTEHRGSISSHLPLSVRRGTQSSLTSLPVTPILSVGGDQVDFDAFQRSISSQIRSEAASFQNKLSNLSRKPSSGSVSPQLPSQGAQLLARPTARSVPISHGSIRAELAPIEAVSSGILVNFVWG